jgi:hypothetical protein
MTYMQFLLTCEGLTLTLSTLGLIPNEAKKQYIFYKDLKDYWKLIDL